MGWLINFLCKKELNDLNNIKIELTNLKIKLIDLQKKYDIDSRYYEDRIKTLENLTIRNIVVPDLSGIITKTTLTDPRKYALVDRVSQADSLYYSLNFNDWTNILTKVRNSFDAKWSEEIFDCDDFSLLISGILAYSVYKSKFKQQLAFGIAWSPTHAYNCFIDNTNTVWVYEPQSNSIIGKLKETAKPYDTVEVWFAG